MNITKRLAAAAIVAASMATASCTIEDGSLPDPQQAAEKIIENVDAIGDKMDSATGNGQGENQPSKIKDPSFEGETYEQLPASKEVALQGELVDAPTSFNNTDQPQDYLNYYRVKGKAVVEKQLQPQQVQYGKLDDKGRTTGAWALVTYDMYDHSAGVRLKKESGKDPSGYAGNNKEVPITYEHGGYAPMTYNGYFYNRSHLIGDLLGGRFFTNNVVTGTRMQNVGWNKASGTTPGGMQYTETLASDHFDKLAAKNASLPQQNWQQCNLYYAAVPNYVGDELVPRTVTVDIVNCDKTIDERVIVSNIAPGYTIDYMTGEFRKEQ